MKNNFFEKLKNLKLSENEKKSIRVFLERKILEYKAPVGSPSPYIGVKSPYVHISKFSFKLVASTLIVFMLIGSGVAFAAENSLPGDTLYPIKIHFNEGVQSALIVDHVAKAQWNEARVEKRLGEIKKLKSEKKLTPESVAVAEKAFVEQSQDLADSINTLKVEGKHEEAKMVVEKILPELKKYNDTTLDENTVGDNTVSDNTDKVSDTTDNALSTQNTGDKLVTGDISEPDTQITIPDDTNSTKDTEIETNTTPVLLKTEVSDTLTDQIPPSDELEARLSTSINAQAKIFDQLGTTTPQIPSDTKDVNVSDITDTHQDNSQSNQDKNIIDDKVTGIVSGTVKIGPICPVESTTNPCKIAPEVYTSRHIQIFTVGDNKTLVSDVAIKADGTYNIILKEGTYTMDIKKNGIDKATGLPKTLTIKAGDKVQLNFSIDTGIR